MPKPPLARGGGSALALTERFLTATCILYKGKALRLSLQLALVQLHDLLHAGVAGVAGTAGVRISGLGEELDVLFLQDAVQVCGDAHVSAQLLDSGDGGICGLCVVHLVDALHAHGLADGTIALTGDGLVVLQTDGQQDSAGHAVGGVIQSGQAVCHGVDDAQTHIGEAHAGDVLAQSHALAAFRSVLDSAAQVLTDELDGFQMEHIGDGAVALGDVALDGVGQSIHTGGGSQALGHGGHHIGVDHSDLGDVVGIDADELALLLHIGDDVVDGDFSGSTGGGGDSDGKDGVLLGGSDAFQRAHIGELGVVDDDADGLCGVHGRAAADGHDAVSLCGLEGGHAVLHIGDGGVGLDLAVDGVGEACSVQQVGDLLGDAELDKVGVRADESLLVAAGGQLGNDVLDGAVAMIRNSIQNDTISHW